MSHLPKFSPPIFTDSPKLYLTYALTVAYLPNFSLPIAFTCTVCQNFPLPNISRVWYLHSYVLSMLSLGSIVISDLAVADLDRFMHSLSDMILLYLAMPYFILKVLLHEFMHTFSNPQLITIFVNACNS